VVFVLNVLAFLLMGLQARAILERLAGEALWHALAFAGMVFAIVVLVRLAWVMSYRTLLKPLAARLHDDSPGSAGSPRLRLLVAWCGMRGILTLATAFSLPADFPGRDVIVLAAFGVVLGTLIIQGSTISLLIRWLGIPSDTSLEGDIAAARRQLAHAGLAALEDHGEAHGRQHDAIREALTSRAQSQGEPDLQTSADNLQLAVVQAQRRALIALHLGGAIAEDAFRVLQQELDWRELSLSPGTAREIAEA
jgi:CPA1 family monovalent cation:H+ antiporter